MAEVWASISNGYRWYERRASLNRCLPVRGFHGRGVIAVVSFFVAERVVYDRSGAGRQPRRRHDLGRLRHGGGDGGGGFFGGGGGTRGAADDAVRAARLRVIHCSLGVRLAVLVERANALTVVARRARYACGRETCFLKPVKRTWCKTKKGRAPAVSRLRATPISKIPGATGRSRKRKTITAECPRGFAGRRRTAAVWRRLSH